MSTPKAPTGTRAPGRRLWSSIVDVYELEEHETALLTEAVRTVDLLDLLDARVREDGPIVDSPQGKRAIPRQSRHDSNTSPRRAF